MSRETDTPSSGPNGRGGAAYPSGTPPYGTPTASDAGADAARSAERPEERKTETTLTTRIRINIPGSRPIPPVVVRTPVAEAEGGSEETGQTELPTSGTTQTMGVVEAPAEPAGPADEKTSDWFAPRKSGPAKGGQGGGATNGAGVPGGSAPAAGAPAAGARPSGPGAALPGGSRQGAGRPGGVVGSMSVPGGARPGGTNGAGLPGATGGPVAPGHGGGTGSFDVTEALAAGPLGGNGTRNGGEPRRDELPYFAEGDRGGRNGHNGQNGQGGYGGQGGANGFDAPGGQGGPQGPAGPTGGPVTGDGPKVPPIGAGPSGFAGPSGPGTGTGPLGPGAGHGPGPLGPGADTGAGPFPGSGNGPLGPGSGIGVGPQGAGLGPGGGLSDDTAILTPQKPAPEPGPQGYPAPDNISGQTVTSGIPVVPPGAGSPFGQSERPEGAGPHTPPKLPEPNSQKPKASASSAPKKKKGRNKLVLLAGVAVVVGVGAYGAGLLMNHSDVPKGTTVLGVDIGGGTRDDAVKKLDAAFGDRVDKPLKLSVGGKTVALKPDQAGLQFDEQSTVAKAAQADYNPISVIGSLFGNHRVVDPVMPVDEEKLNAALQSVAGGSGSMTEGTIKFESGKAVAVYGKAGKGIDPAKSAQAVVEAYRNQVGTDSTDPVAVVTTTKQPTISNAEVDREMKDFAKPAMSGLVTVKTDTGVTLPLSPQNSLWKFLRVEAVNGKLVDKPDLNALKQLYGGQFDGVLITRGTGKKTAVTPQDVYVALRQALLSKTNRVGVIQTNP
ncbi:hypothetical protein [Streptomyces sp. NPDC058954]|uniref:hypothetical protein n=1 Tax=Streptomyces sp. NPDC058954 TaxID=3346677 RepID=UPI0036AB1AF3